MQSAPRNRGSLQPAVSKSTDQLKKPQRPVASSVQRAYADQGVSRLVIDVKAGMQTNIITTQSQSGVRTKNLLQNVAERRREEQRLADLKYSDPGTRLENGLIKCNACGRSFNERAFEKHPDICRRVFQQKRPLFKQSRVVSRESDRNSQRSLEPKVAKRRVLSSRQPNLQSEPSQRQFSHKRQSAILKPADPRSNLLEDSFEDVKQRRYEIKKQCPNC